MQSVARQQVVEDGAHAAADGSRPERPKEERRKAAAAFTRGTQIVTRQLYHGWDAVSAYTMMRPGTGFVAAPSIDNDKLAHELLNERTGIVHIHADGGDVSDGRVDLRGEADVTTSGSPCTEISLAAHMAGDGRPPNVAHPKNTLYHRAAEVAVRTSKAGVHEWPASVLREEYRILQERLLAVYEAAGWSTHEWVFNTSKWGRPTARRRLYTIAFAPDVVREATVELRQPCEAERYGVLGDALEDEDWVREHHPELFIPGCTVDDITDEERARRAARAVIPIARIVVGTMLEAVWDPRQAAVPNKVLLIMGG